MMEKHQKYFNKLDHLMLHVCSPMSNRNYNTVDMWKARWRQNFVLEVLINVRLYASSSPQVCDYLALATGGNTYDSYYPFDDQIAESLMILCLEITS